MCRIFSNLFDWIFSTAIIRFTTFCNCFSCCFFFVWYISTIHSCRIVRHIFSNPLHLHIPLYTFSNGNVYFIVQIVFFVILYWCFYLSWWFNIYILVQNFWIKIYRKKFVPIKLSLTIFRLLVVLKTF